MEFRVRCFDNRQRYVGELYVFNLYLDVIIHTHMNQVEASLLHFARECPVRLSVGIKENGAVQVQLPCPALDLIGENLSLKPRKKGQPIQPVTYMRKFKTFFSLSINGLTGARKNDKGFWQYSTRAPAWASDNASRSGTLSAPQTQPEVTIASLKGSFQLLRFGGPSPASI